MISLIKGSGDGNKGTGDWYNIRVFGGTRGSNRYSYRMILQGCPWFPMFFIVFQRTGFQRTEFQRTGSQRTGFQRTGYPLILIDGYPSMIFIDGCPSMNINGNPSMNMVPVFSLWAPSFGPCVHLFVMDGTPKAQEIVFDLIPCSNCFCPWFPMYLIVCQCFHGLSMVLHGFYRHLLIKHIINKKNH
jgi:hypothetical protein